MKPEEQYEHDIAAVPLGKMMSQRWLDDPKMLGIVLARYKFVAKMLAGYTSVAEVGCGDGWAAQVVEQEIGANQRAVDRYDIDPRWGWKVHDISAIGHGLPDRYDAVFMLDVIEHIPQPLLSRTIDNLAISARRVVIIGTPSLESQRFASAKSREGHVNCMSAEPLRYALGERFDNVFMFGMNDETLHTGFGPMSHYLLALCVK